MEQKTIMKEGLPMEKKASIEDLLQQAINAAVEASLQGIDEKIKEAINLGATIGATAGAEAGAAAAVKAVEKERKKYRKQQYDWKFQNTKLLLRNYRRLNSYYQNAVFDLDTAETEDETFEELMSGRIRDENMFVESIQTNYIKTRIIMTHVNKMLDCYKIMCERSNRQDDKRHWRVIEGLYLADDASTADEIAEREHIDKRTVYRDVEVCTQDLTALFFGIGGIDREQ